MVNRVALLAIIAALTGYGAGLLPPLPTAKDYPANMRVSYLTETNVTAQVNGDWEDVHVKGIKRTTFTGTDPNIFGGEPERVVMTKDKVVWEVITPRQREDVPKLTLKEWQQLQPPVPK